MRGFCSHEIFNRLFFLIFSNSAFSAVSVTPGAITPSENAWLLKALASGGSSVGASISVASAGKMATSTGKTILLPANWTATIPRSTLGQAAAKLLKKAGPYGIAAYTLYELLSPLIGLNPDGTVTSSSTQYFADVGSTCWGSASWANGGWYESPGVLAAAIHNACASAGNFSTTCTSTQCTWTYNGGNSSGGPVPVQTRLTGSATPVPVTENDLAQKIQQSPATSAELFDKTLADTIAQNMKAKDIGLVPDTAPASVTASPVTSPAEVVQSETTPNPDGSTTTTTTTEQTTATPHSTGSTVGDASVDWETQTTKTQTAHNNTTGQDKVTTTTTNSGTSTTAPQTPDYCVGHPDLIGCTPVGNYTIPTNPVTEKPLNVTFNPPASVAGSCPADATKTLSSGQVIAQSYQPVCDFATGVRPAVLAAAFLAAAYIVIGFNRSEGGV